MGFTPWLCRWPRKKYASATFGLFSGTLVMTCEPEPNIMPAILQHDGPNHLGFGLWVEWTVLLEPTPQSPSRVGQHLAIGMATERSAATRLDGRTVVKSESASSFRRSSRKHRPR